MRACESQGIGNELCSNRLTVPEQVRDNGTCTGPYNPYGGVIVGRTIEVSRGRALAVRERARALEEALRPELVSGERRPSVSVIVPTRAERIAHPYRYCRGVDERYHERRVWLSDRLDNIVRDILVAETQRIALGGLLCDRIDSLQADMVRLEQYDLLRALRGALDRYAESVTARMVGREVLL